MFKKINTANLPIIIIIIFNFALHVYRLNAPLFPYLDEKNFFLPAVKNILSGLPDTNFEQPPLGKFLIIAGIKLFGDNPWGWRIPSVIFATFTCLTIYFFAKKLFGGRFIPTVAALLFTFETAWFVHSRIAMIEIFLATFVVAGFYFLWLYIEKNSRKDFIFASVFFGLALTVKWNASFPILAAILALFLFQKTKITSKIKLVTILIILPLLIYLLFYTPFILRNSPTQFLPLQQRMWLYHTIWLPQHFEKVAPFYIPKFAYVKESLNNPLLWLLDKPGTYLENNKNGRVEEILLIYNPLIFWPGIILIIFSFIRGIQTQNKKLIFLFLIFASSYFPWFLSPRFSIPYYLLFGIPVLIINLAYYINLARKKVPLFVYLYLGLVVLTFCLFYPIISYMEVSKSYLALLTSLWQFPIP